MSHLHWNNKNLKPKTGKFIYLPKIYSFSAYLLVSWRKNHESCLKKQYHTHILNSLILEFIKFFFKLWIRWDRHYYLANMNFDTKWLFYTKLHKWLLAELKLYCPQEYIWKTTGTSLFCRLKDFQEKFSTKGQPISKSRFINTV